MLPQIIKHQITYSVTFNASAVCFEERGYPLYSLGFCFMNVIKPPDVESFIPKRDLLDIELYRPVQLQGLPNVPEEGFLFQQIYGILFDTVGERTKACPNILEFGSGLIV